MPSQQALLSRNAESAKIWTLAANDMLDDDVVSVNEWVWLI